MLSNKILDSVDSTTLLGLVIDKLLSFDGHIEKVCKKLASRIAVLRKIRAYLPLNQRLQHYNAIIRPVMSYASTIWGTSNMILLNRILKLQKRAARTIMFADRQAPSVALFNKLSWIPFYEQCKIDKCAIFYKRIHNNLPSYLGDCIILNNVRNSRNTRYANFNAICPRYKRETEGGRTFLVTATRQWNNIPLNLRKVNSLNCFKNILQSNILKDQQHLHHFSI